VKTAPKHQSVTQSPAWTIEQKIEQAVGDIGATIRLAEPARRGELKEFAETLLHDEISSIVEQSSPTQTPVAAQRSNPLFAGVLIALLGGAFFLLFPPVGLALAAIGAILMIWGGILSWRKG
jgi:hypothetical protein